MTVAGFGFRQDATLGSLRDALAKAVAADTAQPITLLATAHDKADASCMRALALEMGLSVCSVTAAQAEAITTVTDGATVRALRGTGSTAEAAALAAALLHDGPTARLLQARAVSADRLATCALAATTSNSST